MERIRVLIKKLQQQLDMNDTSGMVVTTGLLQAQLQHILQDGHASITKTEKVAVVLPHAYINKIIAGNPENAISVTSVASEILTSSKEDVQEPVEELQEVIAAPVSGIVENNHPPVEEKNHYAVTVPEHIYEEVEPPVIAEDPVHVNPEPVILQAQPERIVFELENNEENTVDEIPTLNVRSEQKEVNEIIGDNTGKTELNETLKAEVQELGDLLVGPPVRDLRKAIGINDRYVFLSELFRNDEVMYERSLKTINGFRILAEAEYWIERELKVKLGWDDSKETVKHFNQLVKRRFS